MNHQVTYSARRYILSSFDSLTTSAEFVPTRKPLPPGQSRQKEGWENMWYIGMFGGMVFAAVGLYYKPDTRCVTMFTFRLLASADLDICVY